MVLRQCNTGRQFLFLGLSKKAVVEDQNKVAPCTSSAASGVAGCGPPPEKAVLHKQKQPHGRLPRLNLP